jgi:hypothetical protein
LPFILKMADVYNAQTMPRSLVIRGPNFATFHFRHVSDEEEEGGSISFPFRHVSDDEETKKNTPR